MLICLQCKESGDLKAALVCIPFDIVFYARVTGDAPRMRNAKSVGVGGEYSRTVKALS